MPMVLSCFKLEENRHNAYLGHLHPLENDCWECLDQWKGLMDDLSSIPGVLANQFNENSWFTYLFGLKCFWLPTWVR